VGPGPAASASPRSCVRCRFSGTTLTERTLPVPWGRVQQSGWSPAFKVTLRCGQVWGLLLKVINSLYQILNRTLFSSFPFNSVFGITQNIPGKDSDRTIYTDPHGDLSSRKLSPSQPWHGWAQEGSERPCHLLLFVPRACAILMHRAAPRHTPRLSLNRAQTHQREHSGL
jgi:hypothetical protein